MDSGRIYFDPSCYSNMLFLGNGENIFRGSGKLVLNLEEASKKRPFFSSPDEMYEEEYYDELSPEKKRRLSAEQVHMLEKSFEEENKLEPDRKTQLAKKLGLQPRQVAVWFQNRRARWKTKQLERDYDRLKSSYDSLVSEYESIVKENEQLKTEVVSLTDKLENKAAGIGVAVSNELFDSRPLDAGDIPDLELNMKVEDHLSTGSGGSAVVDDLHDCPQLVDSCDSYFPNDDYPEYVAPIDQSEEDDGSDDGGSYFSNVLAVGDHQHHQHREEEPMPWWVWH